MTRPHTEPDREGDPIVMIASAIGYTCFIFAIAAAIIGLAITAARAGDYDASAATSFCIHEMHQCPLAVSPAFATEKQRPLLAVVLRAVEASTVWTSDQDHYLRPDYWATIIDGKGDCEDYALTERSRLHAAGVPWGAMRLAEVVTQKQSRHMVLEVRFANSDIEVLDCSWNTPYAASDSIYWSGAASEWGSVHGWHSTESEA